MATTEEWAEANGISVEDTPPTVENYTEPYPRSPREIATRVVILQGVVAVAFEVDPEPVVEWLHEQRVWDRVSPCEEAFLLCPDVTDEERNRFRGHQEAEWALLWAIGKVEAIGLPTRGCDTQRLVDEIIPPLGSDIEEFLVLGQSPTAGRAACRGRPDLQPLVQCVLSPSQGRATAFGPQLVGPL